MKDRDFLFHLIKNLNVSEKGYFTKYGFKNQQASSDKLQLRVFNYLSKQEHYDEKSLKQFFFKENPDQLRIVKHHLYNRIVAALNEYAKDEGVENFVWKKLASAKTLIGKGIYDSAEKHAFSAYEEALLAERYDLAYTALLTSRDSTATITVSEDMYMRRSEMDAQQKDCLRKLENLMIYRFLLDKIKRIESKLSSIDYFNNEFRQEMDEINTSPYLKEKEMALSFEATCMYYMCMSYVFSTEKNLGKRHENALQLVRHIESQPQKMKYYTSKYRTAINQYLNSCFSLRKFDNFDQYLEKLVNSSKNLSPHFSARNFLMIENLRLNRNFAVDRIPDNISGIRNFETSLKKHETQLPAESFHALYMNAAISFFHEEMYREAIGYVNKILNEFDERHNKAVIAMAKSINMIAHYELENEELLSYLLKTYLADEKKQGGNITMVGLVANAIQWLLQPAKKRTGTVAGIRGQWNVLNTDKMQKRLTEDAYIDRWLAKRIKPE
jgi:hypothetical protein